MPSSSPSSALMFRIIANMPPYDCVTHRDLASTMLITLWGQCYHQRLHAITGTWYLLVVP